jgi:hypothetical protein
VKVLSGIVDTDRYRSLVSFPIVPTGDHPRRSAPGAGVQPAAADVAARAAEQEVPPGAARQLVVPAPAADQGTGAWSSSRAARDVWLASDGERDPRALVEDAFDLVERGLA